MVLTLQVLSSNTATVNFAVHPALVIKIEYQLSTLNLVSTILLWDLRLPKLVRGFPWHMSDQGHNIFYWTECRVVACSILGLNWYVIVSIPNVKPRSWSWQDLNQERKEPEEMCIITLPNVLTIPLSHRPLCSDYKHFLCDVVVVGSGSSYSGNSNGGGSSSSTGNNGKVKPYMYASIFDKW